MIIWGWYADCTTKRMQLRQERQRAKYRKHRWFAWHPVVVHGYGLVWLENVCRIGRTGYHGGPIWDYFADEDGLTKP